MLNEFCFQVFKLTPIKTGELRGFRNMFMVLQSKLYQVLNLSPRILGCLDVFHCQTKTMKTQKRFFFLQICQQQA